MKRLWLRCISRVLTAIMLILVPLSAVQAAPDVGAVGVAAWTSPDSGASATLYGVASGSHAVVVVGEQGTILRSADGVSWSRVSAGTDRNLMGVTYGHGQFVAVGEKGRILTSPDGSAWTDRTKAENAWDLRDAAYGNGIYVAVGANGVLLSSTDGVTWTRRATGTESNLESVVYGGGRFVAVGFDGVILTSADGVGWTQRSSGVQYSLTGVTYGGGLFVAVGSNDTVVASPDGSTWSSRPKDGSALGLWQVAYGNGKFVSVGAAGTISQSLTGTAWQPSDEDPVFDAFHDVAFINGTFVAVGTGGAIRLSGPRVTPDGPDGAPPPVGPVVPPAPPPDDPPAAPPAHGECKEGKVSGPVGVVRKIGQLTIRSEQVVQAKDGWEEFCGNIVLNGYLHVEGSFRAHPQKLEAEGKGRISVKSSAARFSGTVVLFEGSFSLNGDMTELLKENGLDHFKLAKLDVKISKLRLLGNGVEVAGKLTLPERALVGPVGKITLDLQNVQIINGQVDMKGYLTLDRVWLGNTRLEMRKVRLRFDTKEDAFGGEGTLVLPMGLMLTAGTDFRNARLDSVKVRVDGMAVAIGTTGLYLTSLGGEVSGLAGTTWKVTAMASIAAGPPIAGITFIKARDITLSIDATGRVGGSGTLVFVEMFKAANGEFEVAGARGFRVVAELDLLGFVQTYAELKVTPEEVYGRAAGTVAIPEWVPWLGGQKRKLQDIRFDNEGITAELDLYWRKLGIVYKWRGEGEWTISADQLKVLASREHHLPMLASAGPLPTTALTTPTFTMPDTADVVVVRALWTEGDVDLVLIAPDGTRITPAWAEANPDKAKYQKRPEVGEVAYLLNKPAPGTWKYEVAPMGTATYTVELVEITPRLELNITAPGTDISAAGPVTITWTTNAPVGSKVSLYYATTPTGTGEQMASGLDAARGSYTWNPAGVPTGTYYIYGVVDDGEGAPALGKAAGRVRVVNAKTPAVPVGLTARAANGAIELSWQPNSEADLLGYRAYVVGSTESTAAGPGSGLTWSGLETGRTYQIVLTAVDLDGLESERSAPVTVFLAAPNPPRLAATWSAERITNRETLTVSGSVEAGASAALYRDDELVTSGLTGNFQASARLSLGPNELRLVAEKPNGDRTEISREIYLDMTRPYLSVVDLWPSMDVAASTYLVRGTTEPGADLRLNGAKVAVAADGSFAVPLELKSGENRVDLIARDEAGNEMAFNGVIRSTGAGGPGCGSRFSDVSASHRACREIELLASLKVINGTPEGKFLPDAGVTRAEFAKMLVMALGHAPDPKGAVPFGDARTHWAATGGYIQTAVRLKAFAGFPDGSFRPGDPVTRSQVVKIVAAAAGYSPAGTPAYYRDIRAQDWYAGWVAVALEQKLIGSASRNGLWSETSFRGEAPATRAEAAMVLANLLKRTD